MHVGRFLRRFYHTWQPVEESNTAMGGLADGKRSTLAEDGSATIPEATAGTVGPSGAEARVADDAPESGSMEPVVHPIVAAACTCGRDGHCGRTS